MVKFLAPLYEHSRRILNLILLHILRLSLHDADECELWQDVCSGGHGLEGWFLPLAERGPGAKLSNTTN